MKTIFSPDFVTDKKEIVIEGSEILNFSRKIDANDASSEALSKGEAFAKEIEEKFISDFENPETDKMAHVSTFALIDDIIYMTYYVNKAGAEENPRNQTARLAYCHKNSPENKVFVDIQAVGDTCYGQTVNMVYDTIFARKDENTLMILWTAKVGETY